MNASGAGETGVVGARAGGTRSTGLNGVVLLQAATFCVLWSSAFVAGKIGLRSCPPLILLSMRFLLAAVVMFGVATLLGHSLPRRPGQWVLMAFLGLLNNTLYLGLSFFGLKTVSAGIVTLIVSANPMLTALLAHWLLGERLSVSKIVGMVLGLAGVAFVMRHRAHFGADGALGIVLVVLGTVALSIGTVLFKRSRLGVSLLGINAVQTLFGGLFLLPAALWLEDWGAVHFSLSLWLSLAYLVLVVSVAAVLIWMRLINATSASNASALHFLNPALGMLLGWLILRESVLASDFLGLVPVAVGILLVTRATR